MDATEKNKPYRETELGTLPDLVGEFLRLRNQGF